MSTAPTPNSSPPDGPVLDHLILLVDSLPSTVEHFTGLGFSVFEGGKHADGLTENALIVFSDGIYVEVIAFVSGIDTKLQKMHWWGQSASNGWIDWCLTPANGQTVTEVIDGVNAAAQREGGPERWDAPFTGGRKTKDGKDLNWEVSFPLVDGCGPRGRLPFVCGDVTPREWRVPPPSKPHPNGAVAVSKLVLISRPSDLSAYANRLTSILPPNDLNASNSDPPVARGSPSRSFTVKSPRGGEVVVEVKEPENKEEAEALASRGEGLYSLTVTTTGEEENMGRTSKLGKIVFVSK